MHYEEFKGQFLQALDSSSLRLMTPEPTETLDIHTTDRTFKVYVEPPDARLGDRFYVTAKMWWRWDVTLTARSATTEEDLLVELLGREHDNINTEQPWLRVDVSLRVGVLPNADVFVLPEPKIWSRWVRTVNERLGGPDRLVSGEVSNKGLFMSWRGQPEVIAKGNDLGHPVVSSISVSAFELIKLTRQWDDPDREPDDDPMAQVEAMFGRLERALKVWRESLVHLE